MMISHSGGGGGAEEVFYSTVKSLGEKNELFIILPSKGKLYERLKNEYKIIIVKVYGTSETNLKTFIKFCLNIFSFFKLSKIIKNQKIDVIYSSTVVIYLGYLLAKKIKIKHIWHIHEIYTEETKYSPKIFDYFLKIGFKYSKMIFICNQMKEKWLERLKIREEELNFEIIYNPIKEINNKIKNSKKEITFGFAGKFCKRKNVEILLKVFKEIYDEGNLNIYLILAGEDMKKNVVIEERYINNIKIFDYLEINKFFSKIDIFILPSLAEAWPLVTIEAMKYGLITITTENCGLKEMFKEKENTIYINPLEKEELKTKMLFILKNYKKILLEQKNNNIKVIESYNFNTEFKLKINGQVNEK